MFSLWKPKLYMNVVVVIFLLIFMRPSREQIYTIKNKNYHTHCVKKVTTTEESKYLDLSNEDDHRHSDKIEMSVMGHSHKANESPKMKDVVYHNDNNIYEAKYDLQLYYLLKGLVVVTVIISTIIMNKIL